MKASLTLRNRRERLRLLTVSTSPQESFNEFHPQSLQKSGLPGVIVTGRSPAAC
jgi:hypothetical protein